MKIVFKTNAGLTYVTRVPNYYNIDNNKELMEAIQSNLPTSEHVVEHRFYNDTSPSMEERTQIDLHGEIVDPHIEMQIV